LKGWHLIKDLIKNDRAEDVAQVVKGLHSELKVLSLNPSTAKRKKDNKTM
jgi:hypothetical protein